MPSASHRAAEEFYSLCLSNARTLDMAAGRHAADGDAVALLACAWSADVWVVQAVVWERIMIAAPAPMRQFFRVAEALFADLSLHSPDPASAATCAEVLTGAREGLIAACDPTLRDSIREGWPDQSYASTLAAPSGDDVLRGGQARLHGLSAEAFVAGRRDAMATAMADAQERRVRGETTAAIERAYEADFLGLEAYLVESAVSAGDVALMTVTSRWELAVASVAALPGLPDGFVAAVAAVRDALTSAMSDADALRLRQSLLPV